ncbi:X-Pro dipeptidyl-peptidase [Sphaerisporangium melleum]|uniref:Xaa-Pro dipeptidyl-peptidase n=1 Tax=Sphaerisporangium melleum TaxID=321316 RepID=A0A917VG70_9ACTN|nr:Xaa-Pro dipeptidyl-peptidase [Sphaerisporangium melleum]GGK75759.1 X-Pro dipeptidyl-peptidase [Sphaerisporangium melleum]GII72669.1 X-Pro dipeptidyl-peptidase [Sphaerisporangium melleum]
MPRIRATLAVAVAALTAMGVTPAQADAAPTITVEQGRTQPVFSYADAVREHVYVQSPVDSDADGRPDRVRVDIIRPKESGPGLKVPAIIDESPYYDNSGRGNESERKIYDENGEPARFPLFYDNYFVPRGYAVLNVDMIGTTRSDGCPDVGGRADVLGGKAVIDWLNGRAPAFREDGTPAAADWSTGKAGMIGKSYDGTLANAVAATGVEGLETIVPISAISSWYKYQRSNGVIYNYNYMSYLSRVIDTDGLTTCAANRARLDAGADDATGDYNAFWAERDYVAGSLGDVSKVHASVFVVHTVNDLNVKPDHFSTWWQALAARGVPRKIWVGKYQHVDPFDFEGRREIWVDTLHRWFDHWLLGVRNDVMREPRADVQVGPAEWINQRDWPAPISVDVPLRPAADGSLGLLPARNGATASFTDVRQSEDAMVADVGTAKPGRVAFTTGELPFDLRLSGTPVADLRVSLDAPTANLTALLVDFGEESRIDWRRGQGITTLAEEDCHGESTAADDGCYKKTVTNMATRPLEIVARGWIDARNRDSLTSPSPMTPGVSARIRWKTLPQDYTFKKGHRIALVVAGTDSSYSGEPATGATVTLDLPRSKVEIPLVLGAGKGLADRDLPKGGGWHGPRKVELPVPDNRLY